MEFKIISFEGTSFFYQKYYCCFDSFTAQTNGILPPSGSWIYALEYYTIYLRGALRLYDISKIDPDNLRGGNREETQTMHEEKNV